MVKPSVIVQVYKSHNQRAVNGFYKKYKRNVNVSSSDLIVTATEKPVTDEVNHILGAVIIRETFGHPPLLLFRSLFVAPQYRKSGIASKLTHFALQQFPNKTIFTVADASLTTFYSQFGFIGCSHPPEPLIKLQTKKSLTVMVRP